MKFVFSSFPDFSDNAFVLLYKMQKLEISGQYILLYKENYSKDYFERKIDIYFPEKNELKIKFVKKNTLFGLWHYFTANYSFTTHGMFEQLPKRRKHIKVNLWHGMPLKKIGGLLGTQNKYKIDYAISTAKIFDEVIKEAFKINQTQLISIGQPRNDLFLEKSRYSFLKLFKNRDRTVVWLPTYRQSIIGDIRQDGEFVENQIGGFSISSLTDIEQYLNNKEINLVIKLHPMDILNTIDLRLNFKRIKILKAEDFKKLAIEVNDFLKESSGLITDYSSVYFDYLLLNKPIGLITSDKQAYKNSRGFVNEAIESNFKGFDIHSDDDFKQFIDLVKRNKAYDMNLKKVFNEYDKDGNNCEEILKKIGIIKV